MYRAPYGAIKIIPASALRNTVITQHSPHHGPGSWFRTGYCLDLTAAGHRVLTYDDQAVISIASSFGGASRKTYDAPNRAGLIRTATPRLARSLGACNCTIRSCKSESIGQSAGLARRLSIGAVQPPWLFEAHFEVASGFRPSKAGEHLRPPSFSITTQPYAADGHVLEASQSVCTRELSDPERSELGGLLAEAGWNER
uniref:Transposase n=1 Tax=Panagrellus redivivus TaxID=6233 RepID=A0A7E5A0Q8_PANRE